MINRKLPIQIKEYKDRIENLKLDNQYLAENTKITADGISPMIIDNEVWM